MKLSLTSFGTKFKNNWSYKSTPSISLRGVYKDSNLNGNIFRGVRINGKAFLNFLVSISSVRLSAYIVTVPIGQIALKCGIRGFYE